MEIFQPKVRRSPEKKIRDDICNMLELKGWYVIKTHGNMYQVGLPDLYATHKTYMQRWIEVKLPYMKGSHFTAAQMDVFPKLEFNGTPIWILTGATESEYRKLFEKSNFGVYLSLYGVR